MGLFEYHGFMRFNPKFEDCHPLCLMHEEWLNPEPWEFVCNYPDHGYKNWFEKNKKKIKKPKSHTGCWINCREHGGSPKAGGTFIVDKPQSYQGDDKHKAKAHLLNHDKYIQHICLLSYYINITVILM